MSSLHYGVGSMKFTTKSGCYSRMSTLLSVLLTCWPPGPDDRANFTWMNFLSTNCMPTQSKTSGKAQRSVCKCMVSQDMCSLPGFPYLTYSAWRLDPLSIRRMATTISRSLFRLALHNYHPCASFHLFLTS